MLLLWLSIICMIPFDMSRFDSNVGLESGKKPIIERVLDTAKVGGIQAVLEFDLLSLFLCHMKLNFTLTVVSDGETGGNHRYVNPRPSIVRRIYRH